MRPLRVADSANIVLGLQDEMRRSEESPLRPSAPRRVAGGARHDGPEVAKLLGDARRSVEYWVRGFEERGLGGVARGGTWWTAAAAERETVAASPRCPTAKATRAGGQSVGWQNPGRLDPTAIWDQFRSAAMSAFVPAVGFRFAPTAARHGPGGPGTAAPTHKKNSKR